MSDDIRRSENETDAKKNRSDKCDKPGCKFHDIGSGKCIFETCLLEEIPPLQLKSLAAKCIICGTTYSIPAMDTLQEDRICLSCRVTIKKWIDNCDAILAHIKHPI